jgi:hypothetical protein
LVSAETLHDIVVLPPFRLHKLDNRNGKNLKGFFALDVKSKKEPWRIIIEPLNKDLLPYNPCHIDVIARVVKIIEIKEISNHYE